MLGAIAPWFGGKRNLAPRIVAELGPHRSYWEPFAGSMAVLLAKAPASMETVNDLHGNLTNLARVVRDPSLGPRLYRQLRRVWQCQATFAKSARFIQNNAPFGQPSLECAYHYFIVSWMGRNGVAGTAPYNGGYSPRYTQNGGHAAKRFTSAVASIPDWRRRMRNVSVLEQDALGLIERIGDDEGAVIYCDPPYIDKGADYTHDLAEQDHARLAELLGRFCHARVVLSYYDHPEVRRLYQGWTFVECEQTKAMVNQGQRKQGAAKAPELLIINGPSLTADRGLFNCKPKEDRDGN